MHLAWMRLCTKQIKFQPHDFDISVQLKLHTNIKKPKNSNRPLEHTPDPQLPVHFRKSFPLQILGVPGVC